jgi:hypothetical protein
MPSSTRPGILGSCSGTNDTRTADSDNTIAGIAHRAMDAMLSASGDFVFMRFR